MENRMYLYFYGFLLFFLVYFIFAIKERHGQSNFNLKDWLSILFASLFLVYFLLFYRFRKLQSCRKTMIKIKIELLPFGFSPAKEIWEMEIWNDITGTKSLGNYQFKIFEKNSDKKIWKGGSVKNFQRLRWSVWYLLYLCLDQIYGYGSDK